MERVKNATEAGASVPKDSRQKAGGLHNAWVEMFMRLRPKAVNWATRFWEVVEADRDLNRKARKWTASWVASPTLPTKTFCSPSYFRARH